MTVRYTDKLPATEDLASRIKIFVQDTVPANADKSSDQFRKVVKEFWDRWSAFAYSVLEKPPSPDKAWLVLLFASELETYQAHVHMVTNPDAATVSQDLQKYLDLDAPPSVVGFATATGVAGVVTGAVTRFVVSRGET